MTGPGSVSHSGCRDDLGNSPRTLGTSKGGNVNTIETIPLFS